jgi:hypothetical protein
MGKQEEDLVYTEPKLIRADTSILLGLRMVEKSGLVSGERIKVTTEIGSRRIVIEQMKKGENNK